MSESPTETRSCAAYVEDYHEEDQCTVPGTRTSSQVRTRRSKRDEASDSGYASTSGSRKIFKIVSKMTGTKKSKEATVPPAVVPKKTVTKMSAMPNLRVNTKLESREDAARIQLSGEPIRRTVSNKSQERSPQLLRSAKIGPSPVPIPIRTVPAVRAGLTRPSSYHAGLPDYGNTLHTVQYSAPIQIPRQIPVHHPPPTLSQSYQPPPVIYMPAPMSSGRHVAYPFVPTIPSQHLPSSWEPPYHAPMTPSHVLQPPISRRFSIGGPPIAPPVEYPMVPHRPVYHHHIEHPPPPVFHEPQLSYHPVMQEETLLLEDSEEYYRREQDRHKMPPPKRPPMRHATTIATGVVRPSNRNSMEYGSTPTSSRGSFSSIKDQYRVPLMVRTPSSRDSQTRRSDMPSSTDGTRRTRPKSLYVSYHRELEAEKYQAEKTGSDRSQSLTKDAIERVNKSTKSQKPRASESGSRSSGSRKANEAKKTAELHKKAQSEAVSVEVDQGCTATVTRDAHGVSVRVQSSKETKDRPGRQVEREEPPARHSVSSRRESVTEVARTIQPRRPSSSQPTLRRERTEPLVRTIDLDKRLTDKHRDIDDTAVEDDEYSEPEVPKKRGEKLTAQRLARLKTPSESRQSSRSARSVKSASVRSTTSSRRGIPVERPRS